MLYVRIEVADGRTSIQLAEQERRGGIANRVSPMISMSTLYYSFSFSSLARGRWRYEKEGG